MLTLLRFLNQMTLEIEEEKMAQYRREGIPYGEPEQDSARQVAKRLSVPLPWKE